MPQLRGSHVKYDKPGIQQTHTVGQMIHTPSTCEAKGGVWLADKGTCDLTP
jgi:hypothetical protein